MSESNSIILENWAELKALIDAAEVDVLKNAKIEYSISLFI